MFPYNIFFGRGEIAKGLCIEKVYDTAMKWKNGGQGWRRKKFHSMPNGKYDIQGREFSRHVI